jgi:hypothetical protein
LAPPWVTAIVGVGEGMGVTTGLADGAADPVIPPPASGEVLVDGDGAGASDGAAEAVPVAFGSTDGAALGRAEAVVAVEAVDDGEFDVDAPDELPVVDASAPLAPGVVPADTAAFGAETAGLAFFATEWTVLVAGVGVDGQPATAAIITPKAAILSVGG